ncbi:hypothetical protein Ddye_011477 [Dipteronia dyeriana]|uniref:Uncharacterized protein n=1 Tax=Dipteronia dyeriana TaxID=168575 RepID=A0AAD9X2L4_9ROSI|nr:hypothetical protein Ddye_011477 [Dipteronia dyeriana]
MLLRSLSTPILDSWVLQYSKESSPEPEFKVLQRTKSLCLSNSLLSPQSTPETNLHRDSPKQKSNIRSLNSIPSPPHSLDHQAEKSEPSCKRLQRLLSSSGLGNKKLLDNDGEGSGGVDQDGCLLQTMVMGGGVGSNGGKICGGGGGGDGGGDGGDGGSGFNESNNNNHGSDSTDVYYQKMIEANPSNALLLGNYAKFLKEVKGEYAKAEELCGRAILEDPADGNMLSLYADLIWQTQKDAQRAENYFDQAVKTAPDDCYVLASYARFLWDAEEEEEEEEREREEEGHALETDHRHNMSPPNFFNGTPHHSPLTAAS